MEKDVTKFYRGKPKAGTRGIQSKIKKRFLAVKASGVNTLSQGIMDSNF